MTPLLAPILGGLLPGAGAAVAAGTGAAAAGAGIASAATLLQAGSALAGGISALGQAQGEKQRAKNNAFIGRTRAMQTDVNARQGLESEMATLRATFAANGQRPSVGTNEIMNELRTVRARDRRVEFGNEMATAADYRIQAANAGRAGVAGFVSILPQVGQSLFDYQQLRRRRNG